MSFGRSILCAIVIAGLAALPSACAPAGRSQSPAAMAGWYLQRGVDATFQPCGAAHLRVANGAELRRKAADFGLQDGDPVYVKLFGSRRDGAFRLSGIEQFGSKVPVRDCPMTGTVIQR